MKSFYVYEHWRPDTDLPFYVGKGSGRRARKLRSNRRNPHHQNVVNKVTSVGFCIEVRMVAGGLTEDEAFALERERIAFWKASGIELTNQNAGGEGGRNPSEASRLKMSASAKGRRMSVEARKKMSESRAGVKRGPTSPETRLKISAAKTGNLSQDVRTRIGAAHKGKTLSGVTLAKMAATRLAHRTERLLSQANVGREPVMQGDIP